MTHTRFKSNSRQLIILIILALALFTFSSCNDDESEAPIPELLADAGLDQTICLGETEVLGSTSTAVGGVEPYTFAWSNNAGSTANPTVSPTETTSYTVTVTDARGIEATDEVVITIAEPFIVEAGADQVILAGTAVTLGGTPTASGNATYTYAWDNGAGTTANPDVTPTETTTYTVTVSNEFGCTETDNATITVTSFSVDAGEDVTICAGASTTLGGNPTVTGDDTYTISWDNGAGTEANPTVSPTSATTYIVIVTDINGLSQTDEITVSIAEAFTIDAGSDVTICPGDNATLGGSPTVSGNGTYTYEWSNGAGATANPVVSPTGNTAYELTVTDEFGCTETDEVRVSVSPDFTVDAGNMQQICALDMITLGGNPTVTGAGTYTYSWSDGMSEVSTEANPTITPTSSTIYTVRVTDENGCTKTASTEIGVTQVTAGSVTFNYTGAPQTFTFPDCVTEVTVEVYGAQGEDGEFISGNSNEVPGTGGLGALATGTIILDPTIGNSMNIYVGGQEGFNGGGSGGQGIVTIISETSNGGNGGDASDIRYGGSLLANRIIVAGGGGGGGGTPGGGLNNAVSGNGGDGGSLGIDGLDATGNTGPDPAEGGTGATQSMGGIGGAGQIALPNCSGDNGLSGMPLSGGNGGDGGIDATSCNQGGAGGGGGGGGFLGGGGGGAGRGIGSAATFPAAGGGGGSSYIGGVTNGSVTDGANTGNGRIVISWTN